MNEEPPVTFRAPNLTDATGISQLVKHCPPLDVNSHYVSLLLCRDFHATCVVAERNHTIVGFLSGYRPPGRDDTIFVWQVAIDRTARSLGLASRMLDELLAREECADIRFLEATIAPSNSASKRLFQSLARRHRTECHQSEGFAADLYGNDTAHEPEELHRVGPFQSPQK